MRERPDRRITLDRIDKAQRDRAFILNLSGQGLTALPEAIGQLTQLLVLDLSRNQLTALPEAIGQLTQLQWLDLNDNALTALPEAIGQLTQLQRLDPLSQPIDRPAGGHRPADATTAALPQ